jgi:hypothetical protein
MASASFLPPITELTRGIEILRDVDRWFNERGFGLILTEEEGKWWAHLFPKASLQVSVPRYGGGDTPEGAAQSARERYREEEEGT